MISLSRTLGLGIALLATLAVTPAMAQERGNAQEPRVQAQVEVVGSTLVGTTVNFDLSDSTIAEEVTIDEVLWEFGDGVRAIGQTTSHSYTQPGSYLVKLTIATSEGQSEDTAGIRVFDSAIVLLADSTASDNQLELAREQAATNGILLAVLKAKSNGPEALIEEELTQALLAAREEVGKADLIATWTSGSVGANVLSRFAQQVRQSGELPVADLSLTTKGIFVLSDTPFTVLAPTAQSMFDQWRPAYVLLTDPDALPLLFNSVEPEAARLGVVESPLRYRQLGTFSSRTISELGVTNFMSFGLNYLVNGGVSISNIVLILMIPVIATILVFARQVIGLKAFGILTPAMTTLSFLVLGLQVGLIVFVVVFLSGSLTRLLLKRLQLLYLPRMALVLTSASLAILVMLGVGAATNVTTQLSFTIFPILILTILAEEFIAVQFTQGARSALKLTAWTMLLSVLCYFVVSWELLRTVLLAYPELMLLTIPINIAMGRFTGLRLTEYIRFRDLLRSRTIVKDA
ncbi:hypothetical protein CL628_02670 [bacterium]|nr:hypothetical protein [bacterium]